MTCSPLNNPSLSPLPQDQQGGVICVLPRPPELHGRQGYCILCCPPGDVRQRFHPVESGRPGRLSYLQAPSHRGWGSCVHVCVCVGGEGRAMVFLIERISFYFVVGGWIEVSVTL